MASRKISTGESFVFDAKTKTLYVVKKGQQAETAAAAERLVAAGKAQAYSRDQLRAIQAALSHVALLA